MSSRLVAVSPELLALTEAAGDASPYRLDEPYRQALRGMHARLAATASAPDRARAGHSADRRTPSRTPHPSELLADLDVIDASLRMHGAHAVANGRLAALRGAVETLRLHLATVDLRQNSAVHEQVVAELLRAGGSVRRLLGARRGANGCDVCRRSWRHRGRCSVSTRP